MSYGYLPTELGLLKYVYKTNTHSYYYSLRNRILYERELIDSNLFVVDNLNKELTHMVEKIELQKVRMKNKMRKYTLSLQRGYPIYVSASSIGLEYSNIEHRKHSVYDDL